MTAALVLLVCGTMRGAAPLEGDANRITTHAPTDAGETQPSEGSPPGADRNVSDPVATPDSAKTGITNDSWPHVSRDVRAYGLWVLAPAVVAIVLAILTRQVIPALIVGIVTGAFLYGPCLPSDDPLADANPIIRGIRLSAERYVIGAIHEPDEADRAHIKVMIFTLVIGFMVGVIGRNGGTAGMVRIVAGQTQSPRRGALTAWLAGLVVFFDDYANTMIVGPTMQSVFDKLRLSRAKLAYIVDSTAAPVASLALIGTWVGAEIGYIQAGLSAVAEGSPPAFLFHDDGSVVSGMEAFLNSLCYRYYPILTIFFVFMIGLTGRDFGPMKRAELRARAGREGGAEDRASGVATEVPPRAWLGFFPVLTLVAVTLAVLVHVGFRAPDTIARMTEVSAAGEPVWPALPLWERASIVVRNSDSYTAILYGSLASAVCAVLATMAWRVCAIKEAVDAGLDGMSKMFPAVVILILAWALSAVLQDLQLGEAATQQLRSLNFPARWLPVSVFATAAFISFSTGTSWGTMGILCPMTVTVAAGLGTDLPAEVALSLFYASVGSVLSGAIFGDHCSPISDTTVLSSIASGCSHEEHVWTQLPYALVTAVVAMGVGDVLCSGFDQPWYVGLGCGAIVLVVLISLLGRRTTNAVTETTRLDRND